MTGSELRFERLKKKNKLVDIFLGSF